MIKGVMTFLPKPERNSIWVFAHDAPDQPRRYTGGAGRNIAGSALVTRIHVMASKGRVFALAPLPLVKECLPLLSHFGPNALRRGSVVDRASLKAARRKLLLFS
jgi:hypothetical protein